VQYPFERPAHSPERECENRTRHPQLAAGFTALRRVVRWRAGGPTRVDVIWNFGLSGIALFVALILIVSAVRVLREYERGVVFMLGRFYKVKGPGLILVIPAIQQMVRVELRTIVMDVPSQDVISRDNVSVKVNAVVYFRVIEADKAIIQVANFYEATSQLAQTTLRAVLGKHELDDMLAEREKLNIDIQQSLDAHTDAWGIKVSNVEIKHVDIDESMVRAIAQQAEAERARRAKVIHAQGEQEAAVKLLEAAQMLAQQPQAMQLRFLQTLSSIASDKTNTIVFPVPVDVIGPIVKGLENLGAGAARRRGASTSENPRV
jgi:regulator of protease activity HflC (stomatin/prohibitin superfamily)